jgi:MFS family permease
VASTHLQRSPLTSTIILVTAASAVVLSLSMGLRQSLGLFLSPMAAETGVSASTFGFAMAVQNLAWGLSQPFIGLLADRHGSRAIIVIAGFVYATGLALMALGGFAGLQLGGGLLVGLAISGSAFAVVLGSVSRSVPDNLRPIAVSVVSAVGSVGTLVLAPAGQMLINSVGWSTTLLLFAVFALVMSLAGSLTEQASTGQRSNVAADPWAAAKEALAHKGFVAMMIAFFACGFQLVFIATHLPKYLSICGIPPSVGATALGLIGLFNALGTLIVGYLGMKFGNSLMLALVYLLRTVAIAIYVLTPVTVESTLAFASVMGCYGSVSRRL